jgi:sulfotransferase family protein
MQSPVGGSLGANTDPSHGERLKVLFIAGWTRSGSTLLDNVLNEIDGFFSTGELTFLWRRGVMQKHLCGCGAKVVDCQIWKGVLDTILENGVRGPEALAQARDEVVRLRNLRKILRSGTSRPTGWNALSTYVDVTERVYQALAATTGARVIVNSSKLPHDAAVHLLIPTIDLYLVHLVRDPRAVAFSMQRKSYLQPQHDDLVHMPRSRALPSAMGWIRANIATELVGRRGAPLKTTLLRYEHFAAQPQEAVEQLCSFVGEDEKGIPIRSSTAELHGNHDVWGNGVRFKRGEIEIRLDDAWRDGLKRAERIAVTSVSAPLLRRYGYPLAVR